MRLTACQNNVKFLLSERWLSNHGADFFFVIFFAYLKKVIFYNKALEGVEHGWVETESYSSTIKFLSLFS